MLVTGGLCQRQSVDDITWEEFERLFKDQFLNEEVKNDLVGTFEVLR